MNQEYWQRKNKTLPIERTSTNRKICWICGETFTLHVGSHIHFAHKLSKQEYYDKFFKTNTEGICSECGSITHFFERDGCYGAFCSNKCAQINKFTISKRKHTCSNLYGIDNISQLETVKDKKIQTCLMNNGVEYPFQSEDIRNKSIVASLKLYGVAHPMKSAIVKDHYKAIIVSKYGCENVFQSEVIKQKSCETCLRNHGVEYPSQNIEIFKNNRLP